MWWEKVHSFCIVRIVRLHLKSDYTEIGLIFCRYFTTEVDFVLNHNISAYGVFLLSLILEQGNAFSLSTLPDLLYPILEFCLNFLSRRYLLHHPGMAYQVCHAESLLWMEIKHCCYQVLEFFWEVALWFSSSVYLPKFFWVMLRYMLVEWIILLRRFVERIRTWVHDKQNTSQCKHVHNLTLIWFL